MGGSTGGVRAAFVDRVDNTERAVALSTPAIMASSTSEQSLLRDVLKRVSRSFYVTLAVLPDAVRPQVGLAYLFARAADTIADSGRLDQDTRRECLRLLKAQFVAGRMSPETIREVQARTIEAQSDPGERRLLEELEHCALVFQTFAEDDQRVIAELLPTIIGGMEFDLERFSAHAHGEVTALEEDKDLEYYTYAVAGCVGEFWTKIMCRRLPGLREWEEDRMIPLGVAYGKGLQLVNILKDLSKDLRLGRCYLPRPRLQQAGLEPNDLLSPQHHDRVQPVVRPLIAKALAFLDQGWRYTMAIPRSEVRLRLACMWPILIGLRTLENLSASTNLLDPNVSAKVRRSEIYRIMALTTMTGGCGTVGTAYWGYVRKRVL